MSEDNDLIYGNLSEEDKKFIMDASERNEESMTEKLQLEARIRNEGVIDLALSILTEAMIPVQITNKVIGFYNSAVDNKLLSSEEFKKQMDHLIVAVTSLKTISDVITKAMADGVSYYSVGVGAGVVEARATNTAWLLDQYDDKEGLVFITVITNKLTSKPEIHTHMLFVSDGLQIDTHTRPSTLKDVLWLDCYDELREDFEKREVPSENKSES